MDKNQLQLLLDLTLANSKKWNDPPRVEPELVPLYGVVQPPVIPPPNRPGRLTNILQSLRTVLNAIARRRWAIHFRNPVDAKALGVPEYHTLIKRPMDLGTIRKRLNNKYYCQGSEAIEDFTLIYENCLRFNKEGTDVHKAGVDLKAFFHQRLAQIDLTCEVKVEEEAKPKPKDRAKAKDKSKPKDMPKPKATKRKQSSEETPDLPTTSERSPQPKYPRPVMCYKEVNKRIERSHAKVLLQIMMKWKRRHITWPFKCTEMWPIISDNMEYDHSPEKRLEWSNLEDYVNSDDFKSFDDFVALVWKMFFNGLCCFMAKSVTRTCILETISVFFDTLARFRVLLKEKKQLIRGMVNDELQKMEEEAAAEGNTGNPYERLILASEALKESEAPPPPPPPKPRRPVICYKAADRTIELAHCKTLLFIMRKRKRLNITWPFNRSEIWETYSLNTDYDHSLEKRLDWPILEERLNTGNFESFEKFTALVYQMFQNGLRCFPEDGLIKDCIMETIAVFDATLARFKVLVKERKKLIRAMVAEELEKNGGVVPQDANSSSVLLPEDIKKEPDSIGSDLDD